MFRFSIRDLLLMMLVVAFGVGWFAEHRRAQAATELTKESAKLARLWKGRTKQREYDIQVIEESLTEFDLELSWYHHPDPEIADRPWVRPRYIGIASQPKESMREAIPLYEPGS